MPTSRRLRSYYAAALCELMVNIAQSSKFHELGYGRSDQDSIGREFDHVCGRHRVVLRGEEISTEPTTAVPTDAVLRADKAGTQAITIPAITSLTHSIATGLGIARQDGPDREDRRDGGKQSEPTRNSSQSYRYPRRNAAAESSLRVVRWRGSEPLGLPAVLLAKHPRQLLRSKDFLNPRLRRLSVYFC